MENKSLEFYTNASSKPFSEEIKSKLSEPIDPNHIKILPGKRLILKFKDGLIYLPSVHYRKLLNSIFGPGGKLLIII